ncbi:hypothetical protein PR202_ga17063 [Eleusine coracana subsp. coracana]|uniref:Uncharacterized protein n=1 Tax=Eleusine coracana subsp. coracana TaxID=191504 RepID=A0AAV5CNA0_ELECO|nr:hypothetical protein PR202_ga17063 [Eleusine coracana subsp. coracana]
MEEMGAEQLSAVEGALRSLSTLPLMPTGLPHVSGAARVKVAAATSHRHNRLQFWINRRASVVNNRCSAIHDGSNGLGPQ